MRILMAVRTGAFFAFFAPSLAVASEFCSGFEHGYITGYKQASGSSYEPYTPYCPYQPYKAYNDPESDLEHGYIIGFEQGLQEGRK